MPCQLCRDHGHPDNVKNPICAFRPAYLNAKETPRYSPDNFWCNTVAALREIAEEAFAEQTLTQPHRYINVNVFEDAWHMTMRLDNITNLSHPGEDELPYGALLVMTWYKSRGRTNNLLIVPNEGEPFAPTEEQCRQIIAFYPEFLAKPIPFES